jgi:Zn-dependent protease
VITDLSLQQILTRIVAFVVITGLHGFVLAAVAVLMGDRGVRHDGQLTANPFAHLDMLGLVAAIVSQTGWIRPMPIEAKELRGGPIAVVVPVLASLLVVIGLAMLLMQTRWLPMTMNLGNAAVYVVAGMETAAVSAVWFAVFNLLPLPPLAGGHILSALAPRLAARLWTYVTPIGVGLVVMFIAFGTRWLAPLMAPVIRFVGN